MEPATRVYLVGSVCFLLGFGSLAALDAAPLSRTPHPIVFDLGSLPAGQSALAILHVPAPPGSDPLTAATSCGCVEIKDIERVPESRGMARLLLSIKPDFSSGSFSSFLRFPERPQDPFEVRGRVTPLFEGWPKGARPPEGVLLINDEYVERVSEAAVILEDGTVQIMEITRNEAGSHISLPEGVASVATILTIHFDNEELAAWAGPLLLSSHNATQPETQE